MEIFRIENVSYTYRDGKKALDDVSFHISEGESLTIIGTNGSGKSTLLYILDGILEPESGDISAFGRPLKNGRAEFRQRVSLLFQNPQVQLFSLSVWDELCFGPLQIGVSRDEMDQRTSDILKLLGIEHLKDRGPWNLSGGEMKKVALGTCLSINPDVILMDEPTTGLDPRSQVELIDIINGLRQAGKTIITATHDLGIIQDISDKTMVLGEDHRVMLEGKPWEVIKNTDALLRANLIHKRTHRHSWYVHEHTSPGMHEHEHIPEIISPEGSHDIPGVAETEPMQAGTMSDMDKLRTLLEHWMEHNHEHAGTYLQWAEKARSFGNPALAEMLSAIAAETRKMDGIFEKARKVLGG
jgi:cobalt/nickel transport system ATP-binding protein